MMIEPEKAPSLKKMGALAASVVGVVLVYLFVLAQTVDSQPGATTLPHDHSAIYTGGDTLDAASLTVGGNTVLDSTDLAANGGTLPQLGLDNVFTGQQYISNIGVWLELVETDQAVDEKKWDVVGSNSTFKIRTRTDAGGSGQDAINISRSGTSVSAVTIPNGSVVVGSPTGGAQGAGTINAEGVYVNGQRLDPILKAVKTSATGRSSTTSPTADPHLQLSGIDPTKRYAIEAFLYIDYSSSPNGGVRVQPYMDGLDDDEYFFQYRDPAGPDESYMGSTGSIDFGGSGTIAVMTIEGEINPDSDDTTWELRWAQSSSDAATTTLEDGSWVKATCMNC